MRHDSRHDYERVAGRIHAAAASMRRRAADDAAALLWWLEQDDAALVTRVLTDVEIRTRTVLLANGWAEDDLGELVRRRLKLPAAAGDVERRVRRLALLTDLPPLPEATPPVPTAPAGIDAGVLAKIRALLAKAESTTFPAEAEALSEKAQELMARHRIDRVLLDGRDGNGELPVGRRIWHDDPYADAKAGLLARVASANRCRAIELAGLGCTHVIGFPVDLAMTELLHTSLLVQATRALAAAGPQTDGRGRSRTRSFRQSFLVAYGWRIGERLHEAASSMEAEADEAHGHSLLPVLARREAEVDDAVAAAFPRLRRRRSGSVTNAAGWAAGAAAAELADLTVGRPVRRRTDSLGPA